MGIACLSRLVISDMLESKKLIELNTVASKLTRRLNLLIHRQKQITPSMQHFLTHAAGVAHLTY